MELPFTDVEKRFIVAEVLKSSDVPLQKLVELVNSDNVKPAWSEMLLPGGRTLKNCMDAFDEILESPANLVNSKRKSNQLELPSETSRKRRQPNPESITPVRAIKPKPAANGSPAIVSTPPASTPKKRGRPSKADLKARNEEAIARGEPIPTPKSHASTEVTQRTKTGSSEIAVEGVENEQAELAEKAAGKMGEEQGQRFPPAPKAGHDTDSEFTENVSMVAPEVLVPDVLAEDLESKNQLPVSEVDG